MAEHSTCQAVVLEHLDGDLLLLGGAMLNEAEVATVRGAHVVRDVEHAYLAHGDLDLTHIYQYEGRYTGTIDFGLIRGADRFYDLGHFMLHDGEIQDYRALPALLRGYRDICPLPPDYEAQVSEWSLRIGIRALARTLSRPPSRYQQYLLARVRALIHRSEDASNWS